MIAGDPLFANVSLLLHCEGADASTVFTDSSPTPKTITKTGTTTISTTTKKFGSASLLLPNSSYLTLPASNAAFAFGTGVFTVEFFYWAPNSTDFNYPFFMGGSGTTATVALRIDPGGAMTFTGTATRSGTGGYFTASQSIFGGTWHHVAVLRDASNLFKCYIDGVEKISYYDAANIAAPAVIYLGAVPTQGYYSQGIRLDEVRITKGAARYTGNFTPPTQAFLEASAYGVSGVVRDISGALCSRTVNCYAPTTGVLISSTLSNATTGAYSFSFAATDPVTLLALPQNGEPLNALVLNNIVPS